MDLAFGSLRKCPTEISLNLEPFQPGVHDQPLPSDEEVLAALNRDRADLCEFAPVANMIVTSGDISRAYDILGPVQVDESDFLSARIEQSIANLDRLLRQKAVKLYGSQVDAIINVSDHYSGDSLSYSYWRGFHDKPGTARTWSCGSIHRRGPQDGFASDGRRQALRELQRLSDQGLISREEFERKRTEILKEL